jgi:hypothetical protein
MLNRSLDAFLYAIETLKTSIYQITFSFRMSSQTNNYQTKSTLIR